MSLCKILEMLKCVKGGLQLHLKVPFVIIIGQYEQLLQNHYKNC